jgi:hypothetical protein
MAHRPHMAHLVGENTYGFEFSVEKQQVESSYCAYNHKFPINGLTFEYRNFGNDDVLGKAFSLHQYQSFALFQTKKNLNLDFKIGGGIGYLTKHYDKVNNPTNNAIGSHLNAKVSFKLEMNKYTKQYHFGFGGELSHYSNGTMQTPNLGLNNFALYLNIGYNFNERQVFNSEFKNEIEYEPLNGYFLTEGIFTVTEVLPVPFDAHKYPVFAGRFSYVKPLGNTWGFEFAIDGVYNASNLHRYYDSTFTSKDIPQVGVYAGMSMSYYKSQIVFGMGYYVRDKISPLGKIYNRIGYRYYFDDKLFGLFNIRASFGKADFFEFGVGYKIGK